MSTRIRFSAFERESYDTSHARLSGSFYSPYISATAFFLALACVAFTYYGV